MGIDWKRTEENIKGKGKEKMKERRVYKFLDG